MAQDPTDLIFDIEATDGALDLKLLHLQPMQIVMLWQAFVDNVNPLMKILHVPTAQKALLKATADLSHVSKAMETLLLEYI
jgi:hypothetical protein